MWTKMLPEVNDLLLVCRTEVSVDINDGYQWGYCQETTVKSAGCRTVSRGNHMNGEGWHGLDGGICGHTGVFRGGKNCHRLKATCGTRKLEFGIRYTIVLR